MKKFDKLVIATDLDGTFFGSGATLVQRNLDAVKYFTENGGHFTVSTGRFPYHVRVVFPQVADYITIPAVTCNGSCIYDFAKDATIRVMTIPWELMIDIIILIVYIKWLSKVKTLTLLLALKTMKRQGLPQPKD